MYIVYDVRTLYVDFDVTKLLKQGENAVGAELGNYKWTYLDTFCNATANGGPDGCRAFRMQLVVNMSDSSQVVVVSNERYASAIILILEVCMLSNPRYSRQYNVEYCRLPLLITLLHFSALSLVYATLAVGKVDMGR